MNKKVSVSVGNEEDDDGIGDTAGKQSSVLSLKENLGHLEELQNAHKERLAATESEISQLQKFRSDYEELYKRLKTLPDKPSHEVMVPFGPLAFMPGRLIHTNEILVLLGDNWFAERSSKQAAEIVQRRLKDCDEKIKSAETTKSITSNWLQEVTELFEGEEGNRVEIVETLTEDQYHRSQEEHRKSVIKHYDTLREERASKRECIAESDITEASSVLEAGDKFFHKLGDEQKRTYENLMARLDKLQQEEEDEEPDEEEEELDSLEEVDEEEEEEEEGVEKAKPEEAEIRDVKGQEEKDEEIKNATETDEVQKPKIKRRVSWIDDKRPFHTIIPDNDSEDIFRIRYFTKERSPPTHDRQTSQEEISKSAEGNKARVTAIQSPSDLYKVFGLEENADELQPKEPKGILKKTISTSQQDEANKSVGWRYAPESVEIVTEYPDDLPPPQQPKQKQTAFSYQVVERMMETPLETEPVSTTVQPKKISKFKAARMKKQ